MSSDQQSAFRTRDVINRIVKQIIDEERPVDRYAEVASISPGFCTVVYVGENNSPTGTEHTVKVGAIQPSYVGQRVRIGGPPGDRWVIDVIGQALVNYGGNVAENLVTPTNVTASAVFRRILIQWTGNVAASLYEIQIASDAGFTSIEASYQTTASQFQTPTDFTLGTHFVQVRAATGSAVSDWSGTSVTITPSVTVSDGAAPTNSPDAIVTSALGFIKAEWIPVPNNDIVTYSVHASLESGFIPTDDNKLIETTVAFHMISNFKDGSRLPYDTPTFVRVIACDQDGCASPGAQGFGTPHKVETGDAGNLALPSEVPDGLVPNYSPIFQLRTGGIGYAWLKWDHVINADAVMYEVHISTIPTAHPTANTFVLETPSNFAMVSTAGGPTQTPLNAQNIYYARVHAKDADGYALEPWPPRSSWGLQFAPGKVQMGDVDLGAITSDNIFSPVGNEFIAAGSALIGQAAIGEAWIDDLAVTRAKINQLDSDTGSINWLEVGEAHITKGAIKSFQLGKGEIEAVHINQEYVNKSRIDWLEVTEANITTVRADQIFGGYVSADILDGGSITGVTIDGVTITGGVLQTGISGDTAYAQVRDEGIYFYSSNMSTPLVPGGLKVGNIRLPYQQGALPNGTVVRLSPPKYRTGTVRAPHLAIFDSTSHGGVAEFINTDSVRVPSGSEYQLGLEFGVNSPTTLEEQGPGFGNFNMGFYQNTEDVTLNYSVGGAWTMKYGLDYFKFKFGMANGAIPGHRSEFQFQGDNRLVYYYNGSAVWSQTGPTSDIRKKVNISPIDDRPGSEERALEIIRRVRTIDFEYDPARNAFPAGKRMGIVAQDIQKAFPQGVMTIETPNDPHGDPDTLMLDSPNLISLLWRAIVELDRKIA